MMTIRRHEIEVRQRQKEAAIQAAKQMRKMNGPFVQSYPRSPTRSPRSPRPVRSPQVQHIRPFYTQTNQVYNATISVPGVAYRHVSPRRQSNMSSKGFYVHSLGENHRFHQIPVRSLVPQSAAYQPRPRHAIPDFYHEKRRPGTEPPLRLGAYRPKVITDYFAPHNVREAVTESPSNKTNLQSPSAVYEKEGYTGYKDRGQSW
ncbi:hypothetical protein KUTeg_003131 [Tegillarca granosa]|uniref:Uncharacterized protein n=1 Tax=Tegillarca granosa TaxID=220873 RepID=A0ABQ9FP58_TEGGR|nr:hypothetical protein KUTeg_003131 [Tegillarca granosa]